jgi:triacylglycerol lipase
MANNYPVIMVHGLFGWGPAELGGFPYWGTGLAVPSPLRRLQASVGPLSSMHDRACELACQIHGGQVDYGQAHASAAGHDQHGKTQYSAWKDIRSIWSGTAWAAP